MIRRRVGVHEGLHVAPFLFGMPPLVNLHYCLPSLHLHCCARVLDLNWTTNPWGLMAMTLAPRAPRLSSGRSAEGHHRLAWLMASRGRRGGVARGKRVRLLEQARDVYMRTYVRARTRPHARSRAWRKEGVAQYEPPRTHARTHVRTNGARGGSYVYARTHARTYVMGVAWWERGKGWGYVWGCVGSRRSKQRAYVHTHVRRRKEWHVRSERERARTSQEERGG